MRTGGSSSSDSSSAIPIWFVWRREVVCWACRER